MARSSFATLRCEWSRWLFGVFASVIAATSGHAAPNVDGTWSPVASWPLIPIHATLTPDGRVMTYGSSRTGQQGARFVYDVWDPSAGTGANSHLTLDNTTQTDIFCSSQVVMPQNGQVIIVGGDVWNGAFTTNTGNSNTNIFDPANNTLTGSNSMNRSRWYSASTVLVNGDIYIQGGSGGSDFPEVRQQNGAFRLLTGASTSNFEPTYPHNYLAPDGRIFGYDATGKMYYVNASGTGSLSSQGQFSSANAGSTASAAMFRPGKILQFGGNSNGAVVIDINGPTPVVTTTQAMSTQRQWVNATVLPDGRVLATGGSRVANSLTGVNNSAEIWDPATGTWHAGTSGVNPRLYHSSALLMQDGSVMVGGGGASEPNPATSGPVENLNVEFYYPPYLYDSSGALAPRPLILTAPSSVEVGATLTINVGSTDISRVTLVKTGSVTHSVNMDQRFVELPFSKAGTQLTATLPARASDTPPGFYHLFVLNAAGVPSKSTLLQINIDSTPNTAVDYTATIGAGTGTTYQLACAADETLVGIYGNSQTVVNKVGPECVRVDQFGHWIGNPTQRTLGGGTGTGTAYDKQCARDFAISGFRGRAGSNVDQIDIQCRALTPAGGLTGTGTFLGAVGGTGGTAQALLTCGTENPAYAVYGQASTSLNSFGVLCRTGVITPISTNTTPVVVNPGSQTSVTGNPVSLQIQASDGNNDPLFYDASNLPPGLQIDHASGTIVGIPTTPGDYLVIVSVSDGTETALANFHWVVTGSALLSVAAMPPQPSQLAGAAITYNAVATGGVNVRYKWQFDDGTPDTPFSSSSSVTHTFALPGIYFITLTVTDDLGVPSVQSFVQTAHLPLTSSSPRNSGNIAYEVRTGGASSRVWIVNQDNDTVSVFDATSNAKVAEVAVGASPRSVAIAPDGRVWVANKEAGSISVVSPTTLAVVQTIALPRGSQPFGIVLSAANEAFVALEGAGLVLKLNGSTGAQIGSIGVGPEPRQLSINGNGTRVYVSRFISPSQPGEETGTVSGQSGGANTGGEVVILDASAMTVLKTVVLQHSDKVDGERQGGGVPNYLGAPVVSPDGQIAIVPSKQDNIGRGALRNGLDLNFQNTVRAITSRIDLTANIENYARRIDHDNSSVASAVAYDRFGVYLFVALETSREVAVVDVYEGAEIFRFPVGRAPQGLVVSADGSRLYVSNFMDRTVSVFDLGILDSSGQWNVPLLATLPTVGVEKLSAQVLAGKQIFYDAKDTRIARDAYISCASCHNDGGQDGRVWDFTGFGEGLRNTINLRGPGAAQGRLHWSANFDEVQDFEGQIRLLAGGTGLMSDVDFNTGTRNQPLGDAKAGVSADLDALTAYVGSLAQFSASPYRTSTGALTADASAGQTIFQTQNCAACHSGASFTDSATNTLHDIGTIKPSSGQRLFGTLTGIDTPTLCSVWQSAPYLHDGSAPTLSAAISAHAGVALSAGNLTQLAAYVQQIDSTDCVAPTPLGFARSAGTFSDASGTALSVQLTNVKAGSLLVAYVKWEGAAGSTVTVNGGSSFTADTVNNAGNNDLHGQFFYLPASSTSGTVTFTATWSAARPYRKLMVYEYSYTGGTVTLDASNRATATSGSLTSGNITTTGTDEVVFGAYGEYDTSTTNTERINGVAADQVLRTSYASMWSKSFSAPFTGAATAAGNSPTWIGSIIAFKHNGSTSNTPPTITNIADRSTAEDTGTGAIAFTVGDGQTAVGSLTLSGSSSNQSVVANGGIVFGGSGASRTVTVTPVANASGTATITVTVSDGALTATDTFVLTVTAVNDLPTISSVANQTTAAGVAVGPLAVTVGDVETAVGSLTLSGGSSNTTLVPVGNIVFGGSGAARTVTVTPVAGQSGTATITLTVNDGTGATPTTFTLTVNSTGSVSLGFARSGGTFSDASGTALSVQLTNVKAGSLLVAFVKWEGAAGSTVTVNGGSSFSADTINSAANNDLHGQFFYLPASSASGTVTFTATWSAARPYRKLIVYEYGYTGGTVSLDASNRATGTSGTLTSGNITTTGTDEVVFGAYGEYDTANTTTERINGVAADHVVRASYAAMWSKSVTAPFTGAATAAGNSSTWIGNVIAFKRDAASP